MKIGVCALGAVGAFAGSALGMVEVPFAGNEIVEVENRVFPDKEPSLLPEGAQWKLVWNDEFDQKEIDRTKWLCRENFWGDDFPAFAHDYQGIEMTGETVKLKVFRRGEADYASPHLQTGSLTYDIPKEPTKGQPRFWPFGRRAKPTFMHRYGYYEIRCRLNRFAGWHSAFWIQAPGVGSHPDPAFGGTEVDIMESWKLHGKGADRGYMVGGVIAGGYGSDGQGFTHFQWRQPGAAEGWHNYGVLWTPHGYEFYCDGRKVGEQNCPVSHVEEFLLVSTEPAGYRSLGADGGLSAAGTRVWGRPSGALARAVAEGDFFEIDYVRVYDNAAGYDEPLEELPAVAVDEPRVEDRGAVATNILLRVNRLSTLAPATLLAETSEAELLKLNSLAATFLNRKTMYLNWMTSARITCAKLVRARRAAAAAAEPPVSARPSGTHFVRDAVQPFVDKGQCAGLVSILCNGDITEVACVGWADREKKRPITLDSSYMIASQSKGVCGVAAAILVEEGKLSLDDPVCRYLPAFSNLWTWAKVKTADGKTVTARVPAKRTMTVRNLLTHTAGLPFESPVKDRLGWTRVPVKVSAAMAATYPLRSEPGERFAYSNWGIDVAAAVVEAASGQRFEEFLEKRIFRPLGMKDTTFQPSDELLSRAMEAYVVGGERQAVWMAERDTMPRPYNGPDVFPSAGAGLWSTPRDLVKFYRMLMNRGIGDNGVRILGEKTVKTLLECDQIPEGAETKKPYSLGLHVDGTSGWYGHGGAWSTNCRIHPEKRKLKLLALQIESDGSEPKPPFLSAYEKAASAFLRLQPGEDAGAAGFVGRTSE